MPPGFSARCAACCSPHRSEIDRRLLAGESTRSVSAWLASVGDGISHAGLHRHKNDHLSVAEDVARLAAEAAPHFEAAVQQGLDFVTMLREQAEEAQGLRRLMAGLAQEHGTARRGPPMSVVQMYKASSDEVRQCVKGIRDILDAKPEEGPSDTHDELSAWLASLAPPGGTGGGPEETVP